MPGWHPGGGFDVHHCQGPAYGRAPSRTEQKARTLGLTSATGLVIGSIVGTGVFTMPAVLAGAGTMGDRRARRHRRRRHAAGVLFGQLTKRVPNSDGGLYAYSRHEFGDFAGYLVGWCYWIQAWAGNAAIVVVLGLLRRRAVRHQPPERAWRTGASPWWACGSRRS